MKKKSKARPEFIELYSSPYWTKDKIEITEVLDDGFWIIINDFEYFCTFEVFYWFKGKDPDDIKDVLGNVVHLTWDYLDIDLRGSYIMEKATMKRPVQKNEGK